MRLDIFLPFLKKPKKGGGPAADPPHLSAARRVLPRVLFADKATGKPGLARRVLKWLGPSWLSSPVRRVVQGLCLLLFLWLFFWVCYPYNARPAPVWTGWQPTGVGADRTIEFTGNTAAATGLAPSRTLYAASSGTALGPVVIADVRGERMTVQAAPGFPAGKLEEMQFDLGGPWTFSAAPSGA
ncbi:MAG TPA: 4Fe-4S ferredoxin, partial [Pirellulaceae bacterium]|nr:4Fe-4S ferredoxin [Pirellulaceae bacterium]